MSFSPERLEIARKRQLLNKKEFAESVGVTQQTVTRWLKLDTEPEPDTVGRIAEVLGFPEGFFYGDELDFPAEANFRSMASMTAKVRAAALAAGSIAFSLSDWIEERFDLPEVDVPDLSHFGAGEAADALRAHWQLGERPVGNMIRLLESRGARVFSLAENTRKVNAYSLWRDGKPYVFLNTMMSGERSRFDAAHELAHLVLHHDGKAVGREAEDQANTFASNFLMPRGDFLAHAPLGRGLNSLIKAKKRWKVSLAALVYRLHRLGLMTDWKYRDRCIEISRRGYNKNEPEPIARETALVWKKVLNQLWEDGVTQRDIASELHLPEEEVNSLIFGILAELRATDGDRTLRSM